MVSALVTLKLLRRLVLPCPVICISYPGTLLRQFGKLKRFAQYRRLESLSRRLLEVLLFLLLLQVLRELRVLQMTQIHRRRRMIWNLLPWVCLFVDVQDRWILLSASVIFIASVIELDMFVPSHQWTSDGNLMSSIRC